MKTFPRDVPRYTVTEAARYLRISPTTLRSWVAGREYPLAEGKGLFRPLIMLPHNKDIRLSFTNLVEAHVLRALRVKHELALYTIRDALEYAEKQLKIEHLLVRNELRTDGKDLFIKRIKELVNISRGGQLALRKILDAHLQRIEHEMGWPIRLYPFLLDFSEDRKIVMIDPTISFGRPVTARRQISAQVLAERYDAGEKIKTLAEDYKLGKKEVEEAIIYYDRAA